MKSLSTRYISLPNRLHVFILVKEFFAVVLCFIGMLNDLQTVLPTQAIEKSNYMHQQSKQRSMKETYSTLSCADASLLANKRYEEHYFI